MPRAIKVLAASRQRQAQPADALVLTLDERRTHRGRVVTLKGVGIELDLEAPIWLRTDDTLVLEDGGLIDVVAAPEPLLDVRAADAATFMRVAWVLGDRHVPVQIVGHRLRLRRDPAIATLLSYYPVKIAEIQAPFDPEGGAYSGVLAEHHAYRHDHPHQHPRHHATRK